MPGLYNDPKTQKEVQIVDFIRGTCVSLRMYGKEALKYKAGFE
jgi:hypothetical protein